MESPEQFVKFVQKLTLNTPERRQSIVTLEYVSHPFLVFLLLTLNK